MVPNLIASAGFEAKHMVMVQGGQWIGVTFGFSVSAVGGGGKSARAVHASMFLYLKASAGFRAKH